MSAARLLRGREALVFDLDGTLVDSAGDIRHLMALALDDCGFDAAGADPMGDLHSPLEQIVRGVLQAAKAPPAAADEVVDAYRSRLAVSAYERSAPYPGVVELLQQGMARGQRLAVCTNKRQPEALRMLAHFDLLHCFDVVVGAESAGWAKPHPAPLRMVLQALRAEPGSAVLVGDTHVDAECAHHGGVDFLWHRRGYGSPGVWQAAAGFDSFEELLAAAPA